MAYYFAYGSNMNPERVRQRKMAFSHVELAKLKHYRLAFNKRSTKIIGASSANVMPQTNSEVQGLLYHLNDAQQILAMDPYEGYPIRYDRHLLPVTTESGESKVWVYIANKDFVQEGLKPARWYLNHLLAGSDYLDADYSARLAEVDCLPDSEIEA